MVPLGEWRAAATLPISGYQHSRLQNLVAMTFSVLIPSVPSRREMALSLFDRISAQINGAPVEVLLLLDNKQRTIGRKRQALLDIAQGDYVAFVDDDDTVADSYVPLILSAACASPDVIVFDSLCQINGDSSALVRHGLEFENQQFNPAGFTRTPWHIHPWRREIAQRHKFPDISYGEDWGWCQHLVAEAKTQMRVCAPLYTYRFDIFVTEAV